MKRTGTKHPKTEIVKAECDLTGLLDGKAPDGFEAFVEQLQRAAKRLAPKGDPVFLRTGQTSGKHSWDKCCYVANPKDMARHVAALVEWSHMVSIFGLPHDVWAVREMLPTNPICRCRMYGGFPVAREVRVFVRDGRAECIHPYWPADAIERGDPDSGDWRKRLMAINAFTRQALGRINKMAEHVCRALDDGSGYWSVDFLQASPGGWNLIDMAAGELSWHAPDCERSG